MPNLISMIYLWRCVTCEGVVLRMNGRGDCGGREGGVGCSPSIYTILGVIPPSHPQCTKHRFRRRKGVACTFSEVSTKVIPKKSGDCLTFWKICVTIGAVLYQEASDVQTEDCNVDFGGGTNTI